MIIDVELSFFTNLVLDLFILSCTSLCTKNKAKLKFLSALLGSTISLIIPIFNVNAIGNIAVQIFLSLAMVLISFEIKPIKKFLITYLVFFGWTFVFGGACFAISSSFGQLPLLIVVAISAIVYLLSVIVIKYQNKVKRIRQFSFKVKLFLDDKNIEEEGFLDSGNVLVDPVTNKPIILISYEIFNKLYSNINYLSAYCKQIDTKQFKNGHYVKINTVASGTSILVFTANKVEIYEGEEKRYFENVSVGLSFSGFDKALGKKILLNREFA